MAFGMGRNKVSPPVEKKEAPVIKQKLVSVSVKLRPEQKQKLAELGGDAWIRERIDEALATRSMED